MRHITRTAASSSLRTVARRRTAVGLLALGVLASAAIVSQAQQRAPAARQPAAAPAATPAAFRPTAPPLPAGRPFTQAVPGSRVRFDMVPLPRGVVPRARAAWIGKHEVSWREFELYAFGVGRTGPVANPKADAVSRPSRPYGAPDRGWGRDGMPVIAISFQAAQRYTEWLSHKTGRHFRLPTEAEWEAACRAGAAHPSDLNAVAWHAGNSGGRTHPLGKKRPNAWGIHDMLGNVAEWCSTPDGRGAVRGGSFRDEPRTVNARARAVFSRDWQATDPQMPKSRWWLSDAPFVGFRVLLVQ